MKSIHWQYSTLPLKQAAWYQTVMLCICFTVYICDTGRHPCNPIHWMPFLLKIFNVESTKTQESIYLKKKSNIYESSCAYMLLMHLTYVNRSAYSIHWNTFSPFQCFHILWSMITFMQRRLAACVRLSPCGMLTSGVSPGHERGGWHTACPRICLAFLMNIIGSDKNI